MIKINLPLPDGIDASRAANASGATMDASPNAPMVKLRAAAHRSWNTRMRHTLIDTPIIGKVAPCATASAFTCQMAVQSGMAPTERALKTHPAAKTA